MVIPSYYLDRFFQLKTVYGILAVGTSAVVAAPGSDTTWANVCFAVAYASVIAALATAIGVWLRSDYLLHKCRQIRRMQRDARTSKLTEWIRVQSLEYGAIIGFVLLACIPLYLICWRQEIFELSQLEGTLYPAADPIPYNPCGKLKDDEIAIFTGSNVSVAASFPHTILQIKGGNRISVNKGDDGAIRVTLDIFDSRGTLITRIDNGKFKVLREYLWNAPRKDRSTLEVIDFQGKQVLKMRYLNKQAIWIDAVLHYPDLRNPVIIDGSKSIYSAFSNTFAYNCLGAQKVSISFE